MSVVAEPVLPERPDEATWVHYTCTICGWNRQTWQGLWRHAEAAHGTIPKYAESVVTHHTRRPPATGEVPIYLEP